jgi:hypothetical protein
MILGVLIKNTLLCLFTRNTIFVTHRDIRQRLAKLGSILPVSDAVVRHGATQKSLYMQIKLLDVCSKNSFLSERLQLSGAER